MLQSPATAAGAPDPNELAFDHNLVAEGAIVTAQVMGTKDAATRAKQAARILIDAAVKPASTT